MPKLEANNIKVNLRDLPVVNGLSLTVSDREVVGLIGPNGAGKTSFIRALCGLLPFTGDVHVNGDNIARLSPRRRAKLLSYLPQSHTTHWPLSVYDIVSLARLSNGGAWTSNNAADRAAVDRALSACGITDWTARPVNELSAGERARVLLARALAVEAPVLLVDEPTAALDPHFQLHIMEMLRAYADAGPLVIAVLHDLNLAARFCDRLVLMADGRELAAGAPGDVLSERHLAAAYRIAATHGEDDAGRFVVPRTRI